MKPGDWSRMVKERDGKCLHCGRVEDLHAHHVKPRATHPELRFEITNGITLCYRCHKAEHERNAPVRVRTERPQRRTLERKIADLEEQVRILRGALSEKNRVWEKDRISRESLDWAQKNRERDT